MATETTPAATKANGHKKRQRRGTPVPKLQSIECINPATGEKTAEVPVFSPARIEAAVMDARAAFRTWRRLTFKERAELLLRGRDLILDKRDELIELMIEETGKVHVDAMADLLSFCDTVGYYCKHGARFLADEKLSLHLLKNKRVKSVYGPRGLVVNISPWNFPLDLALNPAITALLAGNVAIIKPSELTPRIAVAAAEALREAGLPKNVLQVVTGYGEAGAQLCQHADFICFTGSVETGRKVAIAAAERLVACTLELGGKDPFIVLEDADVDRASRGAVWGAFYNSGQVCMSVERVYAAEPVYDEFVDRVVNLTGRLRQGPDSEWDKDIGSMTDPRQIDIVEAHIADAVAKGARILTGGERNRDLPGYFFKPTVLVDVDETMDIMMSETFGPVMPIRKVKDAEEALQLANNSEYGLNASVWSKNKGRAASIARELESGAVCINDCIVSYSAVEAPYGGIKHSGLGRRKGPDEIRKYCHQKTVLEDILGLKREPVWYPYSRKTGQLLVNSLQLVFHRGVAPKLSAVRKILGV